jgi:predicted RecA/RadA family phage recombinase
MVALAQGRATRQAIDGLYELPVAAATLIYAGALVALNATGFATKGAVATTLKPFGRAESTVDNSAGAAGALNIQVRTGIFEWVNSAAGDLIGIADVGADCFIVDDQTVAKTNGGATRSRAGKVVGFNGAGVLVQMGPQF